MDWKSRLRKATNAVREAAESETARKLAAKAQRTASELTKKVKSEALDAAQAFVEANADPATLRVQFLNIKLSVVAPSNGLEIARPSEGTLVISDGENNGLIVNAAAKPAYVVETIGRVSALSANTYDLGPEDGVNVVVLDT